MRYVISVLAFVMLFPALASAQDFRANCSSYSERLQPITDSINHIDREIGTSSGNAKQRKSLYKSYDSLLASYQALQNALLGHQNGNLCTVNAKELNVSFNGIDNSMRAWYASLDSKNGLNKDEYKSLLRRSQGIQGDLEQLRKGLGPQNGVGPGMPPNGHPGMIPPGHPNYGQPGQGHPGFGQPGQGHPGFGQPGQGHPGFGQPGQGHPGFGQPGMQQPQNQAMSQQTFDTLKKSIEQEFSDDNKVKVINSAISYSYITAAQEDELLDLFRFESAKQKALKAMHPKVIDPENGFLVYAHFDNASFDVRSIIESNRPKIIYPLSNDTFAKIKVVFNKVRFSSTLSKLGKTVGSYFKMTCAQLIELMKTMHDDDPKVDLATAAYPNLLDRQNWFTVYGAVTFESSKSKLEKLTK